MKQKIYNLYNLCNNEVANLIINLKMNTNTTKNVVASLEWLREAVETAMEEQFKPVYKKGNHANPIVNDIYHVLREDWLNSYEKLCLIALMVQSIKAPMTVSTLSDMTKIHISSVKRAVKKLKSCGILVNHTTEPGFILNEKIIY